MFRSIIFYLSSTIVVLAQGNVNYSSLTGRVTDPSGELIPGAQITARAADTNISSTTKTNPDGNFEFPYLRAGRYTVSAHKDGFADSVRENIVLTVGSAFDLPFQLNLAAAQTAVTVTEEPPVLEQTRTQVAGTVSQAEIKTLPLNGRNFLDLALLVPGVSPTNTASNQLFAETSAVPGQGISADSQRNFSNSFIVDGLSANDDAAGLSGIFYGLDAVQEFQVVTSGGHAEFGRALGSYVNVITKNGTNSLHGDLYGYFRNQRFNAANPLSHSKLPSTQAQYGASLGGPVIHDRTFYFANFEQRILNQSGLITIDPGNVALINARLAAVGYPGSLISTGLYPNPVHSTNFLAKLDHQVTTNDQFSIRYSLYDVDSQNSRGAGALNAATAAANLDNIDQTVAFSNVATLSERAVNETRGQFTYSNLKAPPTDPLGPAVSISGVAAFGTLSASPTARLNKLAEVADSLSYKVGGHTIRTGIDFLYNDLTITYPRSIRGSYSFSSIANFQQGIYSNSGFTQTFGNSVISQTNPNAGIFIQDEWKLGSHLFINAGIRYDLQFLDAIATDTNNISPRLGLAWSPTRHTVVRASAGLFYDRVPLRALANALLSGGNQTIITSASQISVSLSPTQTGAPIFPNILPPTGLPSGVLANFTTMDPHMQNAYSEQGSLEIEQQLGQRSTLSIGYEHLRGIHLIASINQNVPICVASGANNGCRPNSSYANNSQYSPAADSNYNGLHVSFVQRPVKWGDYRISYTYSKALDNVGEFFFSSPIVPSNIWQDYGRSDDDQRHRLAFDGTIHAPAGIDVSGMIQCYSALPLNITSGVTTIQGTAGRPIVNGGFIGRNTGTGPDYLNVNLRTTRTFPIGDRVKLQAIAEAFNLLNHTNVLTFNGNFGAGIYPSNPSSSFGQVTAVNDSRSLQLALRTSF